MVAELRVSSSRSSERMAASSGGMLEHGLSFVYHARQQMKPRMGRLMIVVSTHPMISDELCPFASLLRSHITCSAIHEITTTDGLLMDRLQGGGEPSMRSAKLRIALTSRIA